MMVYHHTGNTYWLTERFRPKRDVRLIAPEDAGLPEDVQREIRTAATDVLCQEKPLAVTTPNDTQFQRMMSFALNEDVPAEYVPMMREQMGFCSLLAPAGSSERSQDSALPVLVVGAGESGIALGAILSDLGIEYQIIERAESSGGTWRDNIYPGLCRRHPESRLLLLIWAALSVAALLLCACRDRGLPSHVQHCLRCRGQDQLRHTLRVGHLG